MGQPHPVYHRPPLRPAGAQRRAAWLMLGWILCWLALIFSPFVGFALHGKVDERGLARGLQFALLPLGALAVLWWLRRADERRVLPAARRAWHSGLLIPPQGAPPLTPPLRQARSRHWIELRADGVLVSRSTLLHLAGPGGLGEHIASLRTADAAGQYFVPWADIDTWELATDREGPDFHRLLLHGGGQVQLRRFAPATGHEADLLDGVRAIGQVPVRLLDDLSI
jgi:hypothetical protein